MIWQADIDRWWHHQNRFTINTMGQRKDSMFILRDLRDGFDVNVFDDELEAREFAFQMLHGVLYALDQKKVTPTKMGIRMMLLRMETDLSSQIGLPDITTRQRDMLDMMIRMVQDALDAEKGGK